MAVIVLAGLFWALGSWYQPRLPLPRDPFVVVADEMLVGGTLTILGRHLRVRQPACHEGRNR